MSVRDHLNIWKDHSLTSAALVLINSFPTGEPEADPGGLEEHRLFNHSSRKMKLCGRDVNDLITNQRMDIAIANFVHSNGLPFSLTRCPKFLKVIAEVKNVGTKYLHPN